MPAAGASTYVAVETTQNAAVADATVKKGLELAKVLGIVCAGIIIAAILALIVGLINIKYNTTKSKTTKM